mmetsp:Transcript_5849/g.17297  ORF Transcript_5849/g.17297 Transcript_5849/m.17297 type:complete len:480 (+) Transcript_5849:72-1511(+)
MAWASLHLLPALLAVLCAVRDSENIRVDTQCANHDECSKMIKDNAEFGIPMSMTCEADECDGCDDLCQEVGQAVANKISMSRADVAWRWQLKESDLKKAEAADPYDLRINFENSDNKCWLHTALQLVLHTEGLINVLTDEFKFAPTGLFEVDPPAGTGEGIPGLMKDLQWVYTHWRNEKAAIPADFTSAFAAALGLNCGEQEDAGQFFERLLGQYHQWAVPFGRLLETHAVEGNCTNNYFVRQRLTFTEDGTEWAKTESGCHSAKPRGLNDYILPIIKLPFEGQEDTLALADLFNDRQTTTKLDHDQMQALDTPDTWEYSSGPLIGQKFSIESPHSDTVKNEEGEHIDLTHIDTIKLGDGRYTVFQYTVHEHWVLPNEDVFMFRISGMNGLANNDIEMSAKVTLKVGTFGEEQYQEYQLKGCAVQKGDQFGGHWCAYMKLKKGWYLADDTAKAMVKVKEESALNACGTHGVFVILEKHI